ncbi:sensor histidine kinase [Glycomyces salinus]|uniref:sensor histidine kinase n=1 Tax=Glycomyces salinus TaxID=980294 RepID=UPI0018EDFC6A|nr:HAMP domain-containing sensor histidine kinase [Glycomyces salinus]
MRSLRARLTVLGTLAIYLPVLLVFAVSSISEREVVDIGPDGTGRSVTETSIEPSMWTLIAVIALAPEAAALAWWWSGRAVRPFERVRKAAERIEASDLSLRIGLRRGTTEAVALAAAFDGMLDRLEQSAQVQRQLVEEASHELRTPLAVLVTGSDVLLDHPEPDLEMYREGLERTRNAAERMRATIDELLVDARGRARTIDRRPTDLVTLARALVDDLSTLAESEQVELALHEAGPVECSVDEPTVRRAVANLVDNAIKHAPEHSRVDIAVRSSADEAVITVTDGGPGIPAEDQPHVFDRFWRGDGTPGTGLGLPIARQIAQAHGGELTLTSPTPTGEGTRFRLSLPRT